MGFPNVYTSARRTTHETPVPMMLGEAPVKNRNQLYCTPSCESNYESRLRGKARAMLAQCLNSPCLCAVYILCFRAAVQDLRGRVQTATSGPHRSPHLMYPKPHPGCRFTVDIQTLPEVWPSKRIIRLFSPSQPVVLFTMSIPHLPSRTLQLDLFRSEQSLRLLNRLI